MTALSELLPSGGGQNEVDFVASGNLANGVPVVLNSNGTVSVVSSTAQNIPLGSEVQFGAAITSVMAGFMPDDNNKFVLVYRIGSTGYCVVGSISGSSISFATPVVFQSGNIYAAITFQMDPNVAGRFVVVYCRNVSGTDRGYARCGQVSGTGIAISAESFYFSLAGPVKMAMDMDPNATGVWALGYIAGGGPSPGRVYARSCRIVSGAPVVGTEVIIYANTYYGVECAVAFDGKTAGAGIFTFVESAGRDSYAQMFRGVDGQSWTNTGSYVFYVPQNSSGNGRGHFTQIRGNPAVSGQYLVVYANEDYQYGAFNGFARVGTVKNPGQSVANGASLTWGPEFTFESTQVYGSVLDKPLSMSMSQTQTGSFLLGFSVGYGNSSFSVREGTILADKSIIFTATDVVSSGSNKYNSVSLPPSGGKFIAAFQDVANSSNGKAVLGQALDNNVYDVVGITSAAISDTATGTVNVFGGVNTQQSSMTVGTEMYAQTNGTISATKTFPAQRLGGAVTATTINMKDLT